LSLKTKDVDAWLVGGESTPPILPQKGSVSTTGPGRKTNYIGSLSAEATRREQFGKLTLLFLCEIVNNFFENNL